MKKKDIEETEIDVLKFNPNFKSKTIDLVHFNKKSIKEQFETIETTLKEIYNGTFIITKKYVNKCIDLTCDPDDKEIIYLPYGLMVEKRGNELIFKFNKKINSRLFVTLAIIFLFAMIAATYSAVNFMSKASLNKDINGDGIPDINIDLDGDGIPDINIDTDGDDLPDINVDYKGNRKSIFNIDTNKDSKPDFNLTDQDLNKDGKCDLNCDLDKDGWPDINIDVDGDGKADLDIDTDNDKKADMNLDLNGDMQCDLYCDTDGDGKCDLFCSKNELQKNEEKDDVATPRAIIKETNLDAKGNPNVQTVTPELIVLFKDSNIVNASQIFPDDQEGVGVDTAVPDKIFTLENTSSIDIKYRVKWLVIKNTFTSNNFKYKVSSTNGGGSLDYRTAPKYNTVFLDKVTISARTLQKYTISFKLQGLNAPQNYDQNKNFTAKIQVEIIDQRQK